MQKQQTNPFHRDVTTVNVRTVPRTEKDDWTDRFHRGPTTVRVKDKRPTK